MDSQFNQYLQKTGEYGVVVTVNHPIVFVEGLPKVKTHEIVMFESSKLVYLGQTLQNIEFQNIFVTRKIIKDLRLKDQKTAVYPTFVCLRLFAEFSGVILSDQ